MIHFHKHFTSLLKYIILTVQASANDVVTLYRWAIPTKYAEEKI